MGSNQATYEESDYPIPETINPVVSSLSALCQERKRTGIDQLRTGKGVIADVMGALDADLQACLVHTGKYRPGDENRAPTARLAADLAEAVAHYC